MITYPNCKINLGLHIVGKRPDGYHNLETIFLPVVESLTGGMAFRDELEIVETDCPTYVQQDGIALDNAPEDNLCMKAYRLLRSEFDMPEVAIRLNKGIPFGAGLGGGSSDAACTLKMLNNMFSLGLSDSELEQRAARIGADCAFFIKNTPAYATGIGDILEPVDIDLSGYRILVELPENEHVSTREAYSGLNRTLFGHPRPDLREVVKKPVGSWREHIVNDFEASVFPMHPAIQHLKMEMYRRGALYASMTGSGSAVFGIFKA